jgi:hypothetical protein
MRWREALAVLLIPVAAAAADGLSGRVVQDDSGGPVASAEVRVRRTGVSGLAADLETDGEGRFQAPGLAAGDYTIAVEKPGYAPLRLSARIPAALMVRLVRLGVISGRVTDASGQPVRGARVLALTRDEAGALQPPARTAGMTAAVDEAGRYRLHGLPPGEYAVAVSYGASPLVVGSTGRTPAALSVGSGLRIHPGNARPEFFTITGGEEHRVDFSILPGALFNVSGKVELPAPAMRFWVALTDADQPVLASAVATAGEDGSFRFDGIPQGSYHLFAAGPVRGYGGGGSVLDAEPLYGRMRVEVSADHVSGLTVGVAKGVSAAIRLRAERGAEAACPGAAQVTVTSLEDWAAGLHRTVDAGFDKPTVIERLAPARYRLTAARLGENCYQASEAVLDLTGSDPGTVTIPLAPAGAIRGRLKGENAAQFTVILLRDGAVQAAVPAPDGRFSFAGLAPGKYRIAVQRSSEAPKSRWLSEKGWLIELDVPGGAPTEVELPAPAGAEK